MGNQSGTAEHDRLILCLLMYMYYTCARGKVISSVSLFVCLYVSTRVITFGGLGAIVSYTRVAKIEYVEKLACRHLTMTINLINYVFY